MSRIQTSRATGSVWTRDDEADVVLPEPEAGNRPQGHGRLPLASWDVGYSTIQILREMRVNAMGCESLL